MTKKYDVIYIDTDLSIVVDKDIKVAVTQPYQMVAERLTTGQYDIFTIHTVNDIDRKNRNQFVAIATIGRRIAHFPVVMLPEEEMPQILALSSFKDPLDIEGNEFDRGLYYGFIKGYNKAKGKGVYTEEDMIKAYEQGTKDGRFHTSYETDDEYVRRNATEYVSSLRAKAIVAVELELDYSIQCHCAVKNFQVDTNCAERNHCDLIPKVNPDNTIHPVNVYYQ